MPQDLEKIALGVAVDRAYSDELKLLWTILDSVKVKADSVKLIEYLEKECIKCVIAISERIRHGVRYEDERYYRRMYKLGRYKVYEDIRACEAFCDGEVYSVELDGACAL